MDSIARLDLGVPLPACAAGALVGRVEAACPASDAAELEWTAAIAGKHRMHALPGTDAGLASDRAGRWRGAAAGRVTMPPDGPLQPCARTGGPAADRSAPDARHRAIAAHNGPILGALSPPVTAA
ncbi:hypothetical protein [Roseicella aerolata]|uniref:Uncharacterized protein n=1 Tax=Roseicella aerolata TaxID=2883479 RepID=A0A9X1ICP9_9PROT|nr:hypothetical protein [Roseicella aerolata]MCB4821791.1 hypothetical protein [Roseicella aerolata]